MKTITITGPMPDATELARKRYAEHTQAGRHALLDTPGDLRNSLPERRWTAAEVLVKASSGPAPISETTTN